MHPVVDRADPDWNLIEGWVAALDDGSQMTMAEHKTWDNVPRDRVRNVRLFVRGRQEPFHVAVAPGDHVNVFMKRAIKLGGPNSSAGRTINMPVVEVSNPARGEGFTRLYVHPVHGSIFSTLDLML